MSFSKYLLSTYEIETVLAAEEVKYTDEDSTLMMQICIVGKEGQLFCEQFKLCSMNTLI